MLVHRWRTSRRWIWLNTNVYDIIEIILSFILIQIPIFFECSVQLWGAWVIHAWISNFFIIMSKVSSSFAIDRLVLNLAIRRNHLVCVRRLQIFMLYLKRAFFHNHWIFYNGIPSIQWFSTSSTLILNLICIFGS